MMKRTLLFICLLFAYFFCFEAFAMVSMVSMVSMVNNVNYLSYSLLPDHPPNKSVSPDIHLHQVHVKKIDASPFTPATALHTSENKQVPHPSLEGGHQILNYPTGVIKQINLLHYPVFGGSNGDFAMDTGNACVASTTGSPMAYLNGVDSNGEDLKGRFLKETEAHTLTIDLRVVRMRPTVEGKRINPTAAFNEIIGVESVDAYYKLLLDVLEAVADQSDTNSPLKIFAFGGVPHSKMKRLLNDREADKLTIDPELFEMHPEALIGGRGLKNLGADTPIEDIVANSITVCSRKEAYLRSD
ncbi:hypothetical protein TrRE_jg5668, partial [Triparma retinervis]